MVCGPEIMMRYCAADLIQAGVPESQIYLTLERNMKCGIGLCGHCQYGGAFMCKDGPVFSFDRIKHRFHTTEI
jgi:NAD(P)H-flavin reductase